MQEIVSVRDADVLGKRVLLRTSLNIPVMADGTVGDTFRLVRALPTLRFLSEKGAKVIIVGYIGRVGATLRPVFDALQKLAPDIKISFTDAPLSEVGPPAAALQAGECLMLENIRREPGEEGPPAGGHIELAKTLASLADIFVDDAFAEAHRAYASNVGVAGLLPSYAGLLFEEEIQKLTQALTPPTRSLAIVGGAKFETKLPLMQKLLDIYPKVLVGGALANDVLKSRGWAFGASKVSDMPMPMELAMSKKLLAPTDAVVGEKGANAERTTLINDIRANEYIVDIGPETIARWASDIAEADFVLWNGPMGIYENGYTTGTDALARALVNSGARAVIGGGDTSAALAHYTFDPERIFISTGGGAMLQFLVDGTLPGIEALRKKLP